MTAAGHERGEVVRGVPFVSAECCACPACDPHRQIWPTCSGVNYHQVFHSVACAASVHLSKCHLGMSHTVHDVTNVTAQEKSEAVRVGRYHDVRCCVKTLFVRIQSPLSLCAREAQWQLRCSMPTAACAGLTRRSEPCALAGLARGAQSHAPFSWAVHHCSAGLTRCIRHLVLRHLACQAAVTIINACLTSTAGDGTGAAEVAVQSGLACSRQPTSNCSIASNVEVNIARPAAAAGHWQQCCSPSAGRDAAKPLAGDLLGECLDGEVAAGDINAASRCRTGLLKCCCPGAGLCGVGGAAARSAAGVPAARPPPAAPEPSLTAPSAPAADRSCVGCTTGLPPAAAPCYPGPGASISCMLAQACTTSDTQCSCTKHVQMTNV